jgi:hypothetical protein
MGMPLITETKPEDPKLSKEVVDLPENLVKEYNDAKNLKETAEIFYKEATQKLLKALGENKKGKFENQQFSKAFIQPKPSLDKEKAWDIAKSLLNPFQVKGIEIALLKPAKASYWRLSSSEKED